MKKKFVQHFKHNGFRINSKKGEAFKKVGELHYFLRLFEDVGFDGKQVLYFEFGIIINSPFVGSYTPFEYSVYLNEACHGGERTDYWQPNEFDSLLLKANSIAIPWIEKYQDLEELSNYILWRIDNGLVWYEPPQYKRESAKLSSPGEDIINLLGGPGNKINFDWVKRFYEPLAIVKNLSGDKESARKYLKLYLEHIIDEDYKKAEISAIKDCLDNEIWPIR